MTKALTKQEPFQIVPANLTEALQLAEYIADSALCPIAYRKKPGDVLVAMQMGAEVGLSAMQSLQGICVINNTPSIFGDAALGVVQSSPMYEWHKEEGTELEATCTIKRKGQEPHSVTFTMKDAIRAGLQNKDNWQHYPKRMLQMRARAFCMRDKFADALKGLAIWEEIIDYPTNTTVTVSDPQKTDQGDKILDKIAPPKETITPEVIEEEKEASPLVFDDEQSQDNITAPEGESESLHTSVEDDFIPPEEELETPPYDGSHDDLFQSVVDQFKGDEKLARGWIKSLFDEGVIKTMASYKALSQKDLQFIWDRLMELPKRED